MKLHPFFLPSAGGRILCTAYRPDAGFQRGPGLLFLPPFAEELNKSRHVIAGLARRLSAAGITTLLPDLYGTGDSEGDFGDARWTIWRANARDAAAPLLEWGCEPLIVGGLRLGAGLALELLDDLPALPDALLLWQPVPSGPTALTQFLRLRFAGSLSGGGKRETMAMLRERLASGERLEVAGYTLSPELYEAIERIDLGALSPPGHVDVKWLEVALGAQGELLPAARKLQEAWAEAGVAATPEGVGGDAFWATQELAHASRLIERTAEWLEARAA